VCVCVCVCVKSYLIILKPENEVRFFSSNRQLSKSIMIFTLGMKYSMRDLICDVAIRIECD